MQQREPIVRRGLPMEAEAIARLNNSFASEGLMLYRTPAMVSLAIPAQSQCRWAMATAPSMSSHP